MVTYENPSIIIFKYSTFSFYKEYAVFFNVFNFLKIYVHYF